MKNNFILGGGITGLIWAYYNKDYHVISNEFGGQMNSDFNLGPRYLYATDNSKNFLKSLNYSIEKATIRVGYLDDNGWIETPDESFKRKYFLKSRGISDPNFIINDKSVMNTGLSEFDVWNVDFPKLIRLLINDIGSERLILGSIKNINLKQKTINIGNNWSRDIEIDYSNLVSTIPLKLFYDFVEDDILIPNLQSTSMTYALVDSRYENIKNFDFVYDARQTTVAHRIAKASNNLVLDFYGERAENEIKSIVDYCIKSKILKNSQIISVNYDPKIENIKFVGRYGTWNRKWKTEMVIDRAIGALSE